MNPSNNITPGHVRAFQAITSRLYDNITLWSCTVNGEPGVAIVMVDEPAAGEIAIMPLFVAITETMLVEFEGAMRERSRGSMKRPRNRFDATMQEVTRPVPA